MGFEQRKRKVAWLHLASLFICIITSPCGLSAPNPISGGSLASSSSSGIEGNSVSSSETGGSSGSSSSMYNMLSEGENRMDVEKHNKSAIFLMGNKGSGQAALAQTIIENYQMESSSTYSYTPEYIVNKENSMAFYNFPAFEASQTPESETASAYFMEKVTKHVTQVKFMFTVAHSSIQQSSGSQGGNAEFDLLVTNAAKLLTPAQTEKFASSIGVVITNVQDAGMSDQVVLSTAESFFVSYKQQLTVQLNQPGLGSESRILVQRKITFMEALLRRGSSGGLSLNSVWFLRATSDGSPGSPGQPGTPGQPGNPGTTPGQQTNPTTTRPSTTTGQPSTPTTTPRLPTNPTITLRPSTTTGQSNNPTITPHPTTPGLPGNPGTPSNPGNPGTPSNPDARGNLTDLYLNRLQFSSVTHSDFTISLATQTLAKIQSSFMPQISTIMQTTTSSAVTTAFTSYSSNFFRTAFINQGSSLNNALSSLNQDYTNIIQSGLISLSGGLTPIFTHPLDPSPHVFHADVLIKLSEFLHISFPTSYLNTMSTMTNWIVFFQQVTNQNQSGPTITETAVISTFNQVHTFRDRVSREVCSLHCGGNGDGDGGHIPGFPFHLR